MPNDTESITVALADPAARSSAAERMRRYRERHRQGLRCLTIELRETEIDALVRMGLLTPEMHNDANAIIEAMYGFFDRTLVSTP